MEFYECPDCAKTIMFAQKVRREIPVQCPYCMTALRTRYVKPDGGYGPHFVLKKSP